MLRPSVLKNLTFWSLQGAELWSQTQLKLGLSYCTHLKSRVSYLQWHPVTSAGPWEWGVCRGTMTACLGHCLL